jgi:hypothetical protein
MAKYNVVSYVNMRVDLFFNSGLGRHAKLQEGGNADQQKPPVAPGEILSLWLLAEN